MHLPCLLTFPHARNVGPILPPLATLFKHPRNQQATPFFPKLALCISAPTTTVCCTSASPVSPTTGCSEQLGALRWISLQASGHSKRLCFEASNPIRGTPHGSQVPPPLSISVVSRATRGCHFSSHSVDFCLLGLQEPTATPDLLHQPRARVWESVF